MTEPLWIGADATHLNGTLDDLSIYSRALSDAEISNLSNNRVGRYEYHHLNGLGGNIVLMDDNQNVLVRFEEQAAIIQDDYRVLVLELAPKHNKNYKGGDFLDNDPELWQLYHLFMAEFREWHQELQPSSSSSTPSTLEEN